MRELSASRKPVCQPGIRLNRDQSASQSASLFSGKHRYEVDCCFFKPWIKFAKCSSLREIWQRRKFWTGLFISLCQKRRAASLSAQAVSVLDSAYAESLAAPRGPHQAQSPLLWGVFSDMREAGRRRSLASGVQAFCLLWGSVPSYGQSQWGRSRLGV